VPNVRFVFDATTMLFKLLWDESKNFRRVQGIAIKAKGRYNTSNDRSQCFNLRIGAIPLSTIDACVDYRFIP